MGGRGDLRSQAEVGVHILIRLFPPERPTAWASPSEVLTELWAQGFFQAVDTIICNSSTKTFTP